MTDEPTAASDSSPSSEGQKQEAPPPTPSVTPQPDATETQGATTTFSADEPSPAWPGWARLYLISYQRAPNQSKAADDAGVARSTVWRLQQRDESFALAVHDAHERHLDMLGELLFASGSHGLPVKKTVTRRKPDGEGGEIIETTVTETFERNAEDGRFYMRAHRREFRESVRVEGGGAGGVPIQVKVDRERSPERLEELVTIAAETGALGALLAKVGLQVVAADAD